MSTLGKFKLGTWVVSGMDGTVYKLTEDNWSEDVVLWEPKVGEWVRHKHLKTCHVVKAINCGEFDDKISVTPSLSFDSDYMRDFMPWIPEVGNFCCFHNGDEQFTVARYQGKDGNNFKLVSCYGKWTEIFKYCEPFIGTIPTKFDPKVPE